MSLSRPIHSHADLIQLDGTFKWSFYCKLRQKMFVRVSHYDKFLIGPSPRIMLHLPAIVNTV